MSANLELVRSIAEAWSRGDYGSREWAHPEIEWVLVGGPAPGTWTGMAGMASASRDFLSAWEEIRFEPEDYRELNPGRLLVLVRFGGRGRTSGLEVERLRAKAAVLFHVRDGAIVKVVFYWDRDRGLAELGLAPET